MSEDLKLLQRVCLWMFVDKNLALSAAKNFPLLDPFQYLISCFWGVFCWYIYCGILLVFWIDCVCMDWVWIIDYIVNIGVEKYIPLCFWWNWNYISLRKFGAIYRYFLMPVLEDENLVHFYFKCLRVSFINQLLVSIILRSAISCPFFFLNLFYPHAFPPKSPFNFSPWTFLIVITILPGDLPCTGSVSLMLDLPISVFVLFTLLLFW